MSAVPGHEFSGVIAAIGEDVQGFEVNDEVYGMNDWCSDGATAEFRITLPQNIARKPKTLDPRYRTVPKSIAPIRYYCSVRTNTFKR